MDIPALALAGGEGTRLHLLTAEAARNAMRRFTSGVPSRHLNECDQGDMMRTSTVEVHDMLSVLSVEELERRIGEVPGVESVTVNHAAGSATVRYDETRVEIADIKSAVRQRGYESAAPAAALAGGGHEGQTAPAAAPSTKPNPSPAPPAAAPEPAAPTAPAGDKQKAKAAPDKS